MTQTIHHPPVVPGERFLIIGHITGVGDEASKCPCKPRRTTTHTQASRGRYGRHQGYNVTVHWWHNVMPPKCEACDGTGERTYQADAERDKFSGEVQAECNECDGTGYIQQQND